MEDPFLFCHAPSQRMFHVVPSVDHRLHTLSLSWILHSHILQHVQDTMLYFWRILTVQWLATVAAFTSHSCWAWMATSTQCYQMLVQPSMDHIFTAKNSKQKFHHDKHWIRWTRDTLLTFLCTTKIKLSQKFLIISTLQHYATTGWILSHSSYNLWHRCWQI